MKKLNHNMIVGTTLTLLLAACGSESADIQATQKGVGSDLTALTSGERDIPSGSGALSDADTGSVAKTVASTSISAEMLATMLNQSGTHHPADDLPPDRQGPPPPGAYMVPAFQIAFPWTAAAPAGREDHVAPVPSLTINQTVNGAYTADLATGSLQYVNHTHARDPLLSHLNTHASFGMTPGVSDFEPRILSGLTPLLDSKRGTPLLSLGKIAHIARSSDPHDPTRAELRAENEAVIRRGESIPLDSIIQYWRLGLDEITLRLRPRDNQQAVHLCLDIRRHLFRRQSCSRWQVPAGWKLGQKLTRLGDYVIDERFEGQKRTQIQHWKVTDKADENIVTTPVARSNRGISGALLNALLTSWSPTGEVGSFSSSAPMPHATGPYGPPVEGSKIGPHRVEQRFQPLSAEDGLHTGTYWLVDSKPLQGTYEHYPVVGLLVKAKITNRTWSNGKRFVDLPQDVELQQSGGAIPYMPTLTSAKTLDFEANELVPFGSLRAWYRMDSPADHRVLLALYKGARRDQVELCWYVRAPALGRRVCTMWNVPADWTPGKALTVAGTYVADDRWLLNPARRFDPADTGRLFWHLPGQP
ncbi:MAG: hypothetical protein Q4D19_10820 [Lautropia sp.]|nr:hypothetical protein [Lautropia sp.]